MGDDCLTQDWVNYLGIYSTVVSTATAILVARLSDRSHFNLTSHI